MGTAGCHACSPAARGTQLDCSLGHHSSQGKVTLTRGSKNSPVIRCRHGDNRKDIPCAAGQAMVSLLSM